MISDLQTRFRNIRDQLNLFCITHCSCAFARLRRTREHIYEILFEHQTTNTRFFFGLTSIFFGIFMIFSPTVHNDLSEYKMMHAIAPPWIWGMGFIISGGAMLYGLLTSTYSKLLLLLEGTLGVAVWVGSAYAVVVTQHSPGAQVIGGFIALWIYARYPTHWERNDGN